ncbi:TIP41-like family-domain-containing protein [Mrakia frigida]|uniref:Tip41p n=1 Tax=Mrakia frigida TaxID=29902 RepID=UPI003FCC05DF
MSTTFSSSSRAPKAYSGPIPEYKLESPSSTSRSIRIADWKISSSTTHIMNAKQIDEAGTHLLIPLPEMTFADNHLELEHGPSGFKCRFGALESLAEVRVGAGWEASGGGVKVKHAEEWGKTRTTAPTPLSPQTPLPTTPVKPFDWTYSSLHTGVLSFASSSSSSSSPTSSPTPTWRAALPTEIIPLALLSQPDPILFYDEIPLFESELDDNGTSVLSARVRVMPHSFFVLQRHFLRVDGVLFRIRDVRLFHLFHSNQILREVSGWEAPYDAIKARLPPPFSDLSPLDNAGWVHQTISGADGRSVPEGVKVLDEGGKAWPGLGKVLEVLDLPRSSVEEVVEGVKGLEV